MLTGHPSRSASTHKRRHAPRWARNPEFEKRGSWEWGDGGEDRDGGRVLASGSIKDVADNHLVDVFAGERDVKEEGRHKQAREDCVCFVELVVVS